MATSLTDLVTKVRFMSNMESNTFVTDQELAGYLNDELAELDDKLVQANEDYNLKSADSTISTTVDNQTFFTVPSDFSKLRAVWYAYGGGWVPLRKFGLQDADVFAFTTIALPPACRDLRYHLQAQAVMIQPAASAPGTYRLWYTPAFQQLVGTFDGAGKFTGAGGSSVFLPAYMDTQAWHAMATAGACAKVLRKQDLDASPFATEKQLQTQRVIDASANRDAGPPRAMRDTRSRRRVWPGMPPWGFR